MQNTNYPITPHVDPPEPPADTGFKPEAEAGEVLREHETYATILADPPWRTNQQGRYGAERHYDTMTLEDIKAMGEALAPYVADNAHLYLWIPNGIVDEGLFADVPPVAAKWKGVGLSEDTQSPFAFSFSYAAKTGLVNGSLTIEPPVGKKLKATVNAVIVNGVGYGTAVFKGIGTWRVRFSSSCGGDDGC